MKLPEFIIRKIWSSATLIDHVHTSGDRIQIINRGKDTGKYGGPDFTGCTVSINEVVYSGSIEIDTETKDWELHGHNTNTAFNDVILHITTLQGTNEWVFASDGRKIHSLPITSLLKNSLQYELAGLISNNELSSSGGLVCSNSVTQLKDGEIEQYIAELGVTRLKNKCNLISEQFASSKENLKVLYNLSPDDSFIWRYTLSGMIFRAMGYTANTENMENLFQLIHPAFFLENADSEQFEQKLRSYTFSMSGLLPELVELVDEESIHFVRTIKETWGLINHYLHAASLPKVVWKFGGIRPASSPFRRIDAAVKLVSDIFSTKFSRLFDYSTFGNKPQEFLRFLRKLLTIETFPFWKNHYDFISESKGEIKSAIGSNRIDEMIINTMLPFYYAYSLAHELPGLTDMCRHIYVNSTLNIETSLSEKMKAGLGLKLNMKQAVNYQGSVELYKKFCEPGKCSECAVGVKVFA